MKLQDIQEARVMHSKYIDWIIDTAKTLNDDMGWEFMNVPDKDLDDVVNQLKNAFGDPLPYLETKNGEWESMHWEDINIDDRKFRVAIFQDGLGKHELVVDLEIQ